MTETIRTVPADKHFPGMTEIEINGRTIACVGVGKHVEQAIRRASQGSRRRGRGEVLGAMIRMRY